MVRPKKRSLTLPDHVRRVVARGKPYYYFQRYRGTDREEKRVAMIGEPYDCDGLPIPLWWEQYRKLAGGSEKREAGTFSGLISVYKQSPEFLSLSDNSRKAYSRCLADILRVWGNLRVAGVQPKHVLALRDHKAAKPAAANYTIRVLSTLLAWSVPRGYRDDNPCQFVKMIKGGDSYEPWSWEQIAFFRDNVIKPELWWAAALALYTGQRQGDCLAMRWIEVQGEWVSVCQQKTGKRLKIPMHRDLQAVLASVPKRSLTILSNTKEASWTTDGFKTSWGKEMSRPEMASLKGLVFHGLRKSAVVFLLEAGCTSAEVAAITGQSMQMVEHYARQVSQQKLAAAAVLKWEASGTA